jgi:hypothetical protein
MLHTKKERNNAIDEKINASARANSLSPTNGYGSVPGKGGL